MPESATIQLEQGWNAARLIPTAGIRGELERERRATSALLAVMGAVPSFGHAILGQLGAPRGRIGSYCEVQLRDGNGDSVSIPDGAVVVRRGAKTWRCLVEVKTGDSQLEREQVARYLELARLNGLDGVLTISNDITATPAEAPVRVDGRLLRRISLWHLSWWRIITAAVMEHRHRGVSDPEQAWILGELVAYLSHEASGAGVFAGMGKDWPRVRDRARNGTLRTGDREARAVVLRWEQLLDFLALGLSQDLGRDVVVVRNSGFTVDDRLLELAQHATLGGILRVPDAAGPISVGADLRARQVTTSIRVDAPREGRPLTRVNWMLRQLDDAPPRLRVEVAFKGVKETTASLLSEVNARPDRLLSAVDPKREPRSFVLALTEPMGQKRDRGDGAFVTETRRQVVEFYGLVVQRIRPWQPAAPKLPRAMPMTGGVPAGIEAAQDAFDHPGEPGGALRRDESTRTPEVRELFRTPDPVAEVPLWRLPKPDEIGAGPTQDSA